MFASLDAFRAGGASPRAPSTCQQPWRAAGGAAPWEGPQNPALSAARRRAIRARGATIQVAARHLAATN